MEPNANDRLSTVGGRIRAVRLAKGMTATQVAEKIEISRPTLSTWENGLVGNIDEDKLKRLAKLLHVSAEWLISAKGAAPELALNIPDRAFVGTRSNSRLGRLESAVQEAVDAVEQSKLNAAALPPENIRMLTGVDKSVPEIKSAAPQFDDSHHDDTRWTMPREVLRRTFYCDPDNVVIKQARKGLDAPDGTPIRRGDYLLIDKTRNAINEPGIYYVADPEGKEAHRAIATANETTGELTVVIDGRADVDKPTDGWLVMGRAMAVFHALP